MRCTISEYCVKKVEMRRCSHMCRKLWLTEDGLSWTYLWSSGCSLTKRALFRLVISWPHCGCGFSVLLWRVIPRMKWEVSTLFLPACNDIKTSRDQRPWLKISPLPQCKERGIYGLPCHGDAPISWFWGNGLSFSPVGILFWWRCETHWVIAIL